MTETRDPLEELARDLRGGDRRALARAITLSESSRADHRADAERMLSLVLDVTGGAAVRIGISGPPGVGKSTFIEAFGTYLTGLDRRVAVLAVDPSSARSGGSILGDKTRMEELARDPNAFIRPSPSGGTLGGVARRTREAVLLCEAAGYDTVLVETVGVGQSETMVAEMVDVFVLVLAPGGGDELQGIKRGIVEIADVVVVNKADGDLAAAAERAAAEYGSALHLLRPKVRGWSPEVLQVSSVEVRGVDAVWDSVGRFIEKLRADGGLAKLRAGQAVAWLWHEIDDQLRDALHADTAVAGLVEDAERDVASGARTPAGAAADLLAAFRGKR